MRPIGSNNIWMSFRCVRNDALDVLLLSMPTRAHPAEKGQLQAVEGRDGKLWIPENAWDRISVSIRLITGPNADIDAVNAWLSGEGDLVFGDEPNRAYHARVTKEFARNNRIARMRAQEFTVTFDCEPFRYLADPGSPITISASGASIPNPGTVASKPLIRVNGYGDGTLMIGGNTMLFDDLSGYVMVDCDAKYVYTGAGTAASPFLPATQKADGAWIAIEPGQQFVSWTGGITSVEITPRWRWI